MKVMKVTKPIDTCMGDLVLCGSTGKKLWRRVIGIDVKSVWRYVIHFSDGYSVSYGSACKFLSKREARCNSF
ncbi:MAG: hypothetical protein [Bacteriophage sp.]|nr:MAG: hypothetical protein [Bacteriophage sp.]